MVDPKIPGPRHPSVAEVKPSKEARPSELVNWQSNVIVGVEEPGWANSITLLVTEVTPPGKAPKYVYHYAATAIFNRPDLCWTAQHNLTIAIKEITGRVDGPVSIWAMLTKDFVTLPNYMKNDIVRLCGEVSKDKKPLRALGYYTRVAVADMFDTDEIPDAVDIALVRLQSKFTLPTNQPMTLTDTQIRNLCRFLSREGATSGLKVVLEGTGRVCSTGERGSREEHSFPVEWKPALPGARTYTKCGAVDPANVASDLTEALESPQGAGIFGVVEIKNMFIPAGFSGGGAYLEVPSTAIYPGARPGAKGMVKVFWHY
jgi:hypothetical protein